MDLFFTNASYTCENTEMIGLIGAPQTRCFYCGARTIIECPRCHDVVCIFCARIVCPLCWRAAQMDYERFLRRTYPALAQVYYGGYNFGADTVVNETAAWGKVSWGSGGTASQFIGPIEAVVLAIGNTGFTTAEVEAPTLSELVAAGAG